LRGIIIRFAILLAVVFLSSCKPGAKEIWNFSTGAPVYASPAIHQNKLIIGSQDHHLYALDLKTGKPLWKRDLGERIVSKPLVLKDSIYIGSGTGDFVHINSSNGDVLWKFKTGDLIHYDACADESGIYFGSGDSTFYKVNYSGEKIWEYKTTKKFWGNCVFYKNVLITSSWDNNFYGLDRTTGAVLWKVSSGTLNFGGPELAGSDVYFATHHEIFRIDAMTGKVVSKAKASNHLDNIVSWKNFMWTNEQGITKRNLDGSAVGRVTFKSSSAFKPVVTNQYLILSADSTMLFAVSDDLKIAWKFKGQDSFWAPGVVHQNIYYTGNRDHKVYAIQLPAN
jgi:outer membrane protein assembly factor BamB